MSHGPELGSRVSGSSLGSRAVRPPVSHLAGDNVAGQRLQGLRPVAVWCDRFAGLLDQRLLAVACAVEAQKRDEGRLAGLSILAQSLARLLAVARHVENVVGDLEGQPDGAGIGPERPGIGAAEDGAGLRRPFDQPAGLVALKIRYFVEAQLPPGGFR